MLGYITGEYDILRKKDLERIDMATQVSQENGNDYFAIGIYDDDLCEKLGLDEPLKKVEDRIKIIQYIYGVDFAFPISSIEEDEIKKSAKIALEQYQEREKAEKERHEEKEFDIVYAPGTYDLFHAGHLENLLEAANRGKKLIVGVKADELVFSHKGKYPILNAQERMEILRHFKFVDDVYRYYTRDPHIAAKWIENKYGKKVDAMFMGTDLEQDFKHIDDIRIIFTRRTPEMMKSRSTSAYKKRLGLHSFDSTTSFTRKKSREVSDEVHNVDFNDDDELERS